MIGLKALNFQLQLDSAATDEITEVNRRVDNNEAGPGAVSKVNGKKVRIWEVAVADGRTVKVMRVL